VFDRIQTGKNVLYSYHAIRIFKSNRYVSGLNMQKIWDLGITASRIELNPGTCRVCTVCLYNHHDSPPLPPCQEALRSDPRLWRYIPTINVRGQICWMIPPTTCPAHAHTLEKVAGFWRASTIFFLVLSGVQRSPGFYFIGHTGAFE
jgi:hypothetical protein